jgi:hypothetical protein
VRPELLSRTVGPFLFQHEYSSKRKQLGMYQATVIIVSRTAVKYKGQPCPMEDNRVN